MYEPDWRLTWEAKDEDLLLKREMYEDYYRGKKIERVLTRHYDKKGREARASVAFFVEAAVFHSLEKMLLYVDNVVKEECN